MYRSFLILIMIMLTQHVAAQGIKQSHHDFTGAHWNGSQPCAPCHLPKDSVASGTALWSSNLTRFNNGAFESIKVKDHLGQPNGKSKLCMSCHDGTVAIERHVAYDFSETDTLPVRFWSNAMDEHPISIPYVTNRAYRLKLNEAQTSSGLGSSIANDLLEDGNIECTSCHDVHVFRNTQGCTGCHNQNNLNTKASFTLSLWKSNDESELCVICHAK